MARIAIINPRFEVSFWGMEYVMPISGKKANLPVAVLPLLAAVTPVEHFVQLIDENVEDLDYDLLDTMDIIGITGMSVQRFRMREIMTELKRRGKFVVVGGAWTTVREDYFGDLADVLFVGEADDTWPLFLREWQEGIHQRRYEQIGQTEMEKLPTPRFDLMKMDRYLFGSIQLSRGCPFLCEFCDIIVTFGRRPRIKTAAQVIAELDALRTQKVATAFIVDDNFIGNKKVVKGLLREIIKYQEENGYPFRLFTETSLDLAEDDELLALMAEANINSVFIGIESPSEDALKETHKNQNVRPKAGSMLNRVHKIQRAGIEVWCGMIVGFDSDDESIFDMQLDFLHRSHIPHIMFGMLYAIPKTPLHARLEREGRLDKADVPEYGTNLIPLRMSRQALQDGYMRVMKELYEPEHYFSRLETLYIGRQLGREKLGRVKYWQRHPSQRIKLQSLNTIGAALFFKSLMKNVEKPELRNEYRSRIWRVVKATKDPSVIFTYIGKCAMHYHYDRLIRDLEQGGAINTL
ncbi:MAG: B12-binding domain-containing radical SAM protein [Candidatus Accumulibacter sp.]|uniref:B12-binding domain-containing radical SAM protein n=1 Tax=Candidatus Accumulibacter proximus TaxID=2954385 RepID=A0A935Q141_9PROT|nr:B12-binding domain-containing radical SAM protein [Candidatus Accumulibacter proximus]